MQDARCKEVERFSNAVLGFRLFWHKKKMKNFCSALDFFVSLHPKREAMSKVTIKDKTFRTSMSEAQIKARVKELAQQMSRELDGKHPLFLAVLNGAFIFAADLMREMTIPCEISFVKLASYQGTVSSGKVTEVIGINEDLTGRTVVIVEDIVETGLTIKCMMEQIGTRNPASVQVCTLFFKPDMLREDLKLDYVAFPIPNDFILGYGLDYDGDGRGLKDLYVLDC